MKKKVFSLLLAGMLTFSMGTTAYATEDAICLLYISEAELWYGYMYVAGIHTIISYGDNCVRHEELLQFL